MCAEVLGSKLPVRCFSGSSGSGRSEGKSKPHLLWYPHIEPRRIFSVGGIYACFWHQMTNAAASSGQVHFHPGRIPKGSILWESAAHFGGFRTAKGN